MTPRASVDIEAPIEQVWSVMLNTGTYAEWNPFGRPPRHHVA